MCTETSFKSVQEHVIQKHDEGIETVKFSPNGEYLAVGKEGFGSSRDFILNLGSESWFLRVSDLNLVLVRLQNSCKCVPNKMVYN